MNVSLESPYGCYHHHYVAYAQGRFGLRKRIQLLLSLRYVERKEAVETVEGGLPACLMSYERHSFLKTFSC